MIYIKNSRSVLPEIHDTTIAHPPWKAYMTSYVCMCSCNVEYVGTEIPLYEHWAGLLSCF